MSGAVDRRVDDGLSAAPVFELEHGAVSLLGSRCASCDAPAFPRRVVCLRCGGEQQPLRLTGSGTLHAWTRLANPPDGFDHPMYYGCVDLDEGPRVLGMLGDEEPEIGQRVRAEPAAARHGALGIRFVVGNA